MKIKNSEIFQNYVKYSRSMVYRHSSYLQYSIHVDLPLEVQKIGRDLGNWPRGKTPVHQSTSASLVCNKEAIKLKQV